MGTFAVEQILLIGPRRSQLGNLLFVSRCVLTGLMSFDIKAFAEYGMLY